jgi:hypothetical protein
MLPDTFGFLVQNIDQAALGTLAAALNTISASLLQEK